jgi:hypothetical protein
VRVRVHQARDHLQSAGVDSVGRDRRVLPGDDSADLVAGDQNIGFEWSGRRVDRPAHNACVDLL